MEHTVSQAKPAILIGLIGTNLQFSKAPQIHMQEGELSGLRYIYRLIDLAALALSHTSWRHSRFPSTET